MRHILLLLTATAFSQFAFAQQKETEVVKNLKSDISFLASDDMQGRLAGSEEDKRSAEYIARQFAAAGLKPYNGNTFQTFDIIKLRIATNKCRLELHFPSGDSTIATKLVQFRDYYPVSESGMNDSAYGLPVFCGYGIEAPKLGFNSYSSLQGQDLKGKIFLIQLGFPGDDTASPHHPMFAYTAIAEKIRTAISHGAAGVVLIPGSPKAEIPKAELERNAQTFPIPVVFLNKMLLARENMFVKIKTVIGAPKGQAYNVFGYRNNHKKQTIIICAHHDHLGHNEYGNSLYSGKDIQVHNGADDNASGVAAMLQLARTLKGKKYNYLFVAFSGEELGLLGSKYFLNQNSIDPKSVNYVINIDMLGRLDSSNKTLIINGTGTSPNWDATIAKLKYDSTSIKIVKSASGLGPSDHASFYLDSIPVLHFFSGQHADYHKPSDDESKINYHGMFLSLDLIEKIIAANNKKPKLAFTKTVDAQPGRRSFKVTMGVMPDYTFTGQGMRLDGVSDGKAAAAAGLMRGDIITKIGDFTVGSVQDYMKALQGFEKGQKATVTFLRNGETKTTEVQF